MNGMNKIEIRSLTKKIKGNIVLDGVDMTLTGGNIYGLIGHNGSGKTMLIRSIAGLMKPTGGEIIYNGETLYKDIDLIPSIGIVIENIGLYPEFTGYKNLQLLASVRDKIDNKTIKKTIAAVGLDPNDKRKVGKYSLGMRQKIVIAQAFMESPAVVLLDEPTNGLDEESVKRVHALCRFAAVHGAIVVIATHNKDDIAELCRIKFKINAGKCSLMESGM